MFAEQKKEPHSTERDVSIDLGKVTLQGILAVPKSPKGIVLFAHGSGSSRLSPRNRFVAEVLRSHGIASLLFDLLTMEEEAVDERNSLLRFNIPLLARRLVGATRWVRDNLDFLGLAIAYFGASTGAAAALMAAAQIPATIASIVSRGGRPDLAGEALAAVQAPTLLIVGENDEPVIALNRQALTELHCPEKRLVIIPGATHLFEEPGALERVADVAQVWFSCHFTSVGQRGPSGHHKPDKEIFMAPKRLLVRSAAREKALNRSAAFLDAIRIDPRKRSTL